MAGKADAVSLVTMLAKATEDDLKAIDLDIETKQNELDQATKTLGDELEALRQLRAVVDVKLHGKPERKKWSRQPKPAASTSTGGLDPSAASSQVPLADVKMADRLTQIIKDSGPCTVRTLALKLRATEQGVRVVLGQNKDRFVLDTEDSTWDILRA